MTSGTSLIAAERIRQQTDLKYTADHDDLYTGGQLALAAACYATPERLYEKDESNTGVSFRDPFPWKWADKRTDETGKIPFPDSYTDEKRIELLVKAGALIAAEIDRLLRMKTEAPNA